ncbi:MULTISPECIES: hypothetical protein [Pseudomonas]|uniref:hypothetical protein n=1 Tax=Pseudomonas TaxID=286 RepID=UPI0005717955|nr:MULTISPECIES: hypothetical protein [Pseudomonas]QUN68449.1 hypothetical protein KDB76_03645 [Pseudomonas sp. JS425]
MKTSAEYVNGGAEVESSFTYQPNFIKMILLVLAFGGMSLYLVFTSGLDRVPGGLTKLLVHLGWDAHVVMKVVGVLGIVFCIYVIMVLLFSKVSGKKKAIRLSSKTLFVPAGHFSSKINEIRCSDILKVSIEDVMNQKFIRVEHKAGKVDLAMTMFKSKKMFGDCYEAILRSTKL